MPHPVARPSPIQPLDPCTLAPRLVIYVVRGRPGPNDRPALPPGSPESWGAITDHTVLDREPYPFPIFPLCRT